jgi:hypothetical protein
MIKHPILLLLLFTLNLSCASKDEKLNTYKKYVQQISDTLKFEDGFNTIKVTGEKRSRFRSYFLNDELVFINEDLNIGNRGTSANKYFFKDGYIIHYTENSIYLEKDSVGQSIKTQKKGLLYLDNQEVLESERFETKKATKFSIDEIKEIIIYSKLLMELAYKNRPESVNK